MISDKINVGAIIAAHFATLRDANAESISKVDLATFLIAPALLAVAGGLTVSPKDDDYIGSVIAVYAIFSALLLNAQIALYTIFRSWTEARGDGEPKDKTKNSELRNVRWENAKKLAVEVNANLSYLILIAAFSLIFCFTFVVLSLPDRIEFAAVTYFISHFFLTLLMAVKRMFRLFETEFAGN